MRLSAVVLGGLAAGLVGCVHPQTARPQIAEEPVDKDAVPTVGSKTEVATAICGMSPSFELRGRRVRSVPSGVSVHFSTVSIVT